MILLDTHALLWFLNDDPKLSPVAKHSIQTNDDVLVSIASIWEITIKHSLGKLDMIDTIETLKQDIEASSIQVLPLRWSEFFTLNHLPWHHKDPFDRIMIAQALSYNLPVVGKDDIWDQYSISRIW